MSIRNKIYHFIFYFCILLCFCVIIVPHAAAQTIPQTNQSSETAKLEKYLTVAASFLGVSDNISLYYKNLQNNIEVSMKPSRSWIPASTIKVFVMLEAFNQRDKGMIDFNEKVTISGENVVPTAMESDEFPTLVEGTQVTIKQLVEMMITQSDNTAYNTLIDILDRRNINNTLDNIGITQTTVGEKLNLDTYQWQIDVQQPGYQNNTITAKDFYTFFDLLYNNQLSGSTEMINILKRQKLNDMIPSLLPRYIPIAHKTGNLAPIYHDGGIIYKPQDNFILSLFTNTNDPNVLAKLAKVAYYRNSDSVFGLLSDNKPLSEESTTTPYEKIYLVDAIGNEVSSVLGETTSNEDTTYIVQEGDSLWSIADKFYHNGDIYSEIMQRNNLNQDSQLTTGETLIIPSISSIQKFPEITAADLGISYQDLSIKTENAAKISPAIIMPNSFFYPLKKNFENLQLFLARTPTAKVNTLLSLAKVRLSEAKRYFINKDFISADQSLNQTHELLKQAVNETDITSDKDTQLYKINQINQAIYASLGQNINNFTTATKNDQEIFVDTVYDFYKKEQQDIIPKVAASQKANPLQEKPIIATISKVDGENVSIQYDDGKVQQMTLSNDTPVRSFGSQKLENKNSLKIGSKIAVMGKVDSNNQINPQFVLEVPPNLPSKYNGKVIEIKPKENILKILDNNGSITDVLISPQTALQSRNSDVGLVGIKVGSMVTVYGLPGASTSSANINDKSNNKIPAASVPAASLIIKSNSSQSEKTSTSTNNSSVKSNTSTETNTVNINATTVTVTQNSSGSREKIDINKPEKSDKNTKIEDTGKSDKTNNSDKNIRIEKPNEKTNKDDSSPKKESKKE